MQLICKHDPSDPDHLICETKHSPIYDWLRRRWQEFYCSGPTCPPHKAYTHLIVDVLLGFAVLTLLAANALFMISGRRVQEAAATLEERIAELEALSSPQPSPLGRGGLSGSALPSGEGQSEVGVPTSPPRFSLQAEALYFSSSGEQLGRGPWPLAAGKTSKLKVVLNPGFSFADFQSVEVSGKLAPYVSWTGFAPLGRGLSFEPASRTVRWRVETEGSAVFEVAVTPPDYILEEEALVIMENVRLRGQELASGAKREVIVPDAVILLD